GAPRRGPRRVDPPKPPCSGKRPKRSRRVSKQRVETDAAAKPPRPLSGIASDAFAKRLPAARRRENRQTAIQRQTSKEVTSRIQAAGPDGRGRTAAPSSEP